MISVVLFPAKDTGHFLDPVSDVAWLTHNFSGTVGDLAVEEQQSGEIIFAEWVSERAGSYANFYPEAPKARLIHLRSNCRDGSYQEPG